MNDNEFSKVGLYEHNARSYRKIKEAYETGEKIVGIVHATGTGKSYNALQLAYDNPNKKIIYVVPNNSIAEHIENIIRDNPNLDRERDFPNLEFRTYHNFINYSYEELEELDCDLLILDEFHHLGAPVWGSRIKAIIETHPEMLVFGMTAYTVRDRGTPYERDMANPDGGELFSNKIVSRYDLVDAMLDGVLPRDIIYRTSYINLLGLEQALENKINNMKATKEELEQYKRILETIKKRVAEAPGITEVVRKYVKSNGKYFYFCPVRSEEGTNDINTIMNEAYEWFKTYIPEEDIVFYSTTSEMKEEGKYNREMFYNDKTLDGQDASKKLRVMFAINQYNEGVHAPNVDGVIMGRGTTSDIVYFEQLGRALSVGGDTKEIYAEYDKYTYEELLNIAKNKEISIPDNITREELIEKIIAPVLIDLTNNIEFIKELEDNIKNRVRERREKSTTIKNISKLMDVSFDIDIVNEDLYQVLSNLRNRMNNDWDSMYELAKSYYQHYGNSNIPMNFKTFNGIDYDENGFNIGIWFRNQKSKLRKELLSDDKKSKLLLMNIKSYDEIWNERYLMCKNYYEYYGNLDIPISFKTKNGKDYNEEGFNIGEWIREQRAMYRKRILSQERIDKLLLIGIKFRFNEERFEEMYKLAEIYYNHYGNLEIPTNFKTKNGIDADEEGRNLGKWIRAQSALCRRDKLKEDRKNRLLSLGMIIDKDIEYWNNMYSLAKKYYEHYGNLEIPSIFKTSNGIDYDKDGQNLGNWMSSQRRYYQKNTLSEEQKQKLNEIGIVLDLNENKWNKMYNLAKKYYEHYGNSDIEDKFITKNGTEYDEFGEKLGSWIAKQRRNFKAGKLSEDKIKKLELIGMKFSILDSVWEDRYLFCKKYCEHYNTANIPQTFRTSNGIDYDENGINIGHWFYRQFIYARAGKLSEDKAERIWQLKLISSQSKEIKVQPKILNWDSMYKMAKEFYEVYERFDIEGLYKTDLGRWIKEQQELYRKKRLSKDQIIKLKEIGIIEGNIKKQIQAIYDTLDKEGQGWTFMYDLAKIYYKHNNHLNIPEDFRTIDGYNGDENGIPLGRWYSKQKVYIKQGKLSEDRIKLLQQIGLKEELKKEYAKDLLLNDFDYVYNLLENYYNHHNNLNIPTNFKTLNGIDYSDDGIDLYEWFNQQIELFKNNKLDKNNREKFEQFLMKTKTVTDTVLNDVLHSWNAMYHLLKKYYEHHENVDVPLEFRTFNGYEENPNGYELGFWVSYQKIKGKSIGDNQYMKLKKLNMTFSKEDSTWEKSYDLAIKYYNRHQNLDISSDFKTLDGINYSEDEEAINLYQWKLEQLDALKYNQYNKYRIEKLEKIGITFNREEEYNFNKMYNIAKSFYEKNGHLDVTFKYFHNPNATENYDEKILDIWILMCKDRYRKGELDEETVKKLSDIGMFQSSHEVKWNHMYKLACNYLEHWGNLYVPLDFKTENGYKPDDKGYELGRWIVYQRNKYNQEKLEQDRIDKLNSINMVWDVRNNKQDNIQTCNDYGIDYKRFGKTLKHISNIELVAKINYLLSIGENIVYTHIYRAHEIFTMSSIDIKNKYGYTLEELINEYYIVDKKNRGI